MISLVLLPFLCLYYFYENKFFEEERAMNLGFVDKESFEEFKKKNVFPIPRNYKEFVFNNSIELEKDKLEQIQLSVRELKKTNDTINGVKIHLGKKTTYAVFIRLMDILGVEEEMPMYSLYKDDLWVLMPNKSKMQKEKKEENNRVNCGTQAVMWAEAMRLEEIKKGNEKQEFKDSFFKDILPILLAFLGIVILNIFALVKFNKNRKFNQKTYI